MTALHAFDKAESGKKRSQILESNIGVGGAVKDLPESFLPHNLITALNIALIEHCAIGHLTASRPCEASMSAPIYTTTAYQGELPPTECGEIE